jgi:hypothetical protein
MMQAVEIVDAERKRVLDIRVPRSAGEIEQHVAPWTENRPRRRSWNTQIHSLPAWALTPIDRQRLRRERTL